MEGDRSASGASWGAAVVDSGSGPISYEIVDLREPWQSTDSRPVVLQHGLGLGKEVWRPWARALARTRPVVAVDLRGHGGSAAAWTEADYPIERFAQDVLCVLDELGIDECHFAGESFGGTIGLHLAVTVPERIVSVTTVSAAYRGRWLTNVGHWPELVFEEGIEAWSEQILNGRFVPGSVPPALVEWVRERQCELAPAVVAGIVRSLQLTDLEDGLREVAPRLAIIAPSGSPFVDVSRQLSLYHLVDGAELLLLSNAMHGIVVSHWRECSAATASFIERVDAGAAPAARSASRA